MSTPAEQLALSIVQRLQGAGHVAYFAGGCVRDRLMGNPPKDFDVATSATPDQVLKLFPRSQQVGAAFGVILVREKKRGGEGSAAQVEVATFRSDGVYSDGRHPDSVRFTDAQGDARRRDFTCNGLFFDPLAGGGQGKLHDFVGGRKDIEQKILRAIGDPAARFGEDHLRMLRAVRFAVRLSFAIEPGTFEAIRSQASAIRAISKERIHDEVARILEHPSRPRAGPLLQELGLLAQIWPAELFPHPHLPRYWPALQLLEPDTDFVLGLIALYRDAAASPEDNPAIVSPPFALRGMEVAGLIRRDLLLTNEQTEDFAWLLDQTFQLLPWQSLPKAPLKRLIADPRWPRLERLFVAHHLDPALVPAFNARILGLKAEGVAPSPFVTGETLIRLGAKPGPAFKGWLDSLYDRQLDNEFATSSEAVAAARELLDKSC